MKIGVLGGGQLGRMLALAGLPLGLEFVFVDPAPDACAALLGEHLQLAYEDAAAASAFTGAADVVTYEFENVPVEAALAVARRRPLRPGAAALQVGQDRLAEKRLFESLGIAVPRFAPVDSEASLHAALAEIGLPAVLKTRRLGYDGKGQYVLASEQDARRAYAQGAGTALILEQFVRFERELSCLAVRAPDGTCAFYPVVENVHRHGILQTSRPRAADVLQQDAEAATRRIAEHLDYVGVLAVEYFAVGGRLLANELAPRVHNSGHWSIEGAVCSQFENHLRAISGMPLGDTALRGPCAMRNLIGRLPQRAGVLSVAGAHLHVYGKAEKAGRKVGHVTVTAPDAVALEQRLAALEALLGPGL